MDKQSFTDMLMPAAIEVSRKTGVDPRIIVAQAAIETGWGKHAPGNNYFGIKSHGTPGGQSLATTEYVNGEPVQIIDSFRGYKSPAESVLGYGDFINSNARYTALRNAKGMDAQLSELQKSGYATDPAYALKVGAVARGLGGTSARAPDAEADPSTWQMRGTLGPEGQSSQPAASNALTASIPDGEEYQRPPYQPPPSGPVIATMGADPFYARNALMRRGY